MVKKTEVAKKEPETIKIAFPTDEHFPFQDDRARSVALQVVETFGPNVVVGGSDGLDFYTLSTFDKDPMRAKLNSIQDEIRAWSRGQREWADASPGAERRYIVGNHEHRLARYLKRHPEFFDLEALKLENLLDLGELGYENGVEDEVIFGDTLVVKHGSVVRKSSAYTARGELEKEKYAISTMSGHTHRGGTHFAATRTGVKQAHECMCLCETNVDYVKRPDWQQGIALATIKNGILSVEQVLIHSLNGKRVSHWRDKEYEEQ